VGCTSGPPTLSSLAVRAGSLTGCLDSRPAPAHRGQRRPARTPRVGGLSWGRAAPRGLTRRLPRRRHEPCRQRRHEHDEDADEEARSSAGPGGSCLLGRGRTPPGPRNRCRSVRPLGSRGPRRGGPAGRRPSAAGPWPRPRLQAVGEGPGAGHVVGGQRLVVMGPVGQAGQIARISAGGWRRPAIGRRVIPQERQAEAVVVQAVARPAAISGSPAVDGRQPVTAVHLAKPRFEGRSHRHRRRPRQRDDGIGALAHGVNDPGRARAWASRTRDLTVAEPFATSRAPAR